MRSNFAPQFGLPVASASRAVEETYYLAGINLRDPDESMPAGESPWTINSRMFARNDGESRVTNRTRKGSGFLASPVGETLNVQDVGTVTAAYQFGPLSTTSTRTVAQKFTPNANGNLTRVDLEIDKVTGVTGHILVEIRADNSGVPSTTVLAQGAILSSSVATSMGFLSAYFIDAPALVNGTVYWIVWYVQDNGVGTFYGGTGGYYANQAAGSGGYVSTDSGSSWSSLASDFRYKTYLSTAGQVTGYHLRYPSDPTKNLILFRQGSSIYSTTKAGAAPTSIDTVASTGMARFVQFQDKTFYCLSDGSNAGRSYDGTTAGAIGGTFPTTAPTNLKVWKDRLFVMSAGTRVDFSDLNAPTSFTNTNFFYVPSPQSSDHMTGWRVFQDHLVIFTHNTKHIIMGSDISTFTRKEAVGTKGAVSNEAMDSDRNFIYFMAPDKQVYAFNGVADVLLSEKVQPELQGISDTSQVRIHLYRNQVRVYYPKTPSSYNNRCLIYDLELKQWFLDTDHPVAGSASLYQDNDELLEFSSQVGQVMWGEYQFSDMGKALDWKFWTNYKTYAYRRRNGQTFGGGSAKKRIKRFRPVVRVTESPYNLSVGKDLDFLNQPDMRNWLVDGGGAKWGSFKWGDGTLYGGKAQINNRAGMSGRGQYLQYRFERKGVETPVELYGYIAQYKMGKQK